MKTSTVRVSDEPLVEVGVITHNGREFAALGAVESKDGERVVGYVLEAKEGDPVWHVGAPLTVQNWDGTVSIGRVIWSKCHLSIVPNVCERVLIRALRVKRADGSIWYGRYSPDGGNLVRLKRCKG